MRNLCVAFFVIFIFPGVASAAPQDPTFTKIVAFDFGHKAGDVDRDGSIDLVGPFLDITFKPFVASYLGNGALLFILSPPSPMQAAPSGNALFDTNGDGALDFVTSYYSNAKKIGNQLGAATGAFGVESYFTTFENYQTFIVVGDGNGDGVADGYIMCNDDQKVSEMFGLVDGTFGGSPTYATGEFPVGGVITDLDGDGFPDRAFVSSTKWNIYHSGSPNKQLAATYYADSGAGADINGDGRVDLIYISNQKKIGIYYNSGGGVYGPERKHSLPNQGFSLAFGDLNRDGRLDILASGGDGLCVLYNSAAGLKPAAVIANTAVSMLEIVDFDSDGFADIGSANGIFINNSAAPAGIANYGAGTPGCYGKISAGATEAPAVGNATFKFTCVNAPRCASGIGMISTAADVAGTNYYNFLIHIDLARIVHSFDATSDPSGTSVVPTPIPNDPVLHGMTFYTQFLWIEDTILGAACGASPAHVAASAGLSLVIP